MIISFEVARHERRGALPLHDTRIRQKQKLLSTNQEQLPPSDRIQTQARNDVAGKEPRFLRAVDAPRKPCLRTDLGRASSIPIRLRHIVVVAFGVPV